MQQHISESSSLKVHARPDHTWVPVPPMCSTSLKKARAAGLSRLPTLLPSHSTHSTLPGCLQTTISLTSMLQEACKGRRDPASAGSLAQIHHIPEGSHACQWCVAHGIRLARAADHNRPAPAAGFLEAVQVESADSAQVVRQQP